VDVLPPHLLFVNRLYILWARVAITGQNTKTLDAAVTELGHGVLAVQADVTNVEDIGRAVAAVVETVTGGLDLIKVHRRSGTGRQRSKTAV